MMRGQKIEVERLESGLYKIKVPHENVEYVSGLASTAIALMRIVFITEAREVSNGP